MENGGEQNTGSENLGARFTMWTPSAWKMDWGMEAEGRKGRNDPSSPDKCPNIHLREIWRFILLNGLIRIIGTCLENYHLLFAIIHSNTIPSVPYSLNTILKYHFSACLFRDKREKEENGEKKGKACGHRKS